MTSRILVGRDIFQRQSSCDQNEQTHNVDRPFQCSQCEKAERLQHFHQTCKDKLQQRGARGPIRADYCSKHFAQGSRLRRP